MADAALTWTINGADRERSAKFKPVLLQERMNPDCTYCNSCDSQWFFNRLHSIIIERCLLAPVPFTISLPTWISGWTKRNNRQRMKIKTKREAFGSVHLCVTVHCPGTQTDWMTDWLSTVVLHQLTVISVTLHTIKHIWNAFTQEHKACVSSIMTYLSRDGCLSPSLLDQNAVIHDNSVWLCQRWNCRLDRVMAIEATELC